jgi:hypothetical protein
MRGETNLQTLLAGVRASLSDTPFTFTTVASLEALPPSISVLATFQEEEGVSVIAPLADVKCAGIACNGRWAKISLAVHSSLSAVGLTAAISSALSNEGISANVVAAYFHDHIFVPWDERHGALDILTNLGPSPGSR